MAAIKKLFKVVYTLSSGKSIVYTMEEENALMTFECWKRYKDKKNADKCDLDIIEVSKLREGQITEKLGIDISKIDAIQIDDSSSSFTSGVKGSF